MIKSASMTLTEAEEMVALTRQKKLSLIENFQFLHHKQHQFVRDIIHSGEIGKIRCFRSSFGFLIFNSENNIRYKKELGGGALLDAGAYVLKATSFMMHGLFSVKAAHLNYHKKYDVDWFGGAFLLNKTSGVFSEVAFGFDNSYQCNYEIWGSKGKVVSNRAFTAKKDYNPTIQLEKQGKSNEIKLETDDHFFNMQLHINNLLKNENYDLELTNILGQARLIQQINIKTVKQ
ncbi:MAG: NDP-hexose-3-ketoreductase [Psychroserpens sp.]|jgi:NDP-hexose-3-ketoreductase